MACAAAGEPRAEGARAAVLGVPFDGTVSYRAGAREAPAAIRWASDSIESYCPLLGRDLEDARVVDLGDVEVDGGLGGEALVERLTSRLPNLPDVPLLVLGGDHLVALPFMARALERHPDLAILQVDAHLDLRDEWDGSRWGHATVMRRVLERMPPSARIYGWGVRSGARQEFRLAHDDARIELVELDAGMELAERLRADGRPVYVTLDADGIDPAEIPGTGNPEPAGLAFGEVEAVLCELARGGRCVGADLVEIAPPLDPTGRSAVAGARLARTLLLALSGAAASTPES